MSRSDAIVSWLFQRLVLDTALAGDLREERAQGRSAIWYWRQVLIAIWTATWRPAFQHKLLALRALATGCAVNGVWLLLWLQFLHIGLPVKPEVSFAAMASLAAILFTQFATGWIIACTHRPYAVSMVFVFAVWLVLWFLVSGSPVKTLLVDSFGEPEFFPYLAWYLMPESVMVLGLLLGSLAGASAIKGTPSLPQLD